MDWIQALLLGLVQGLTEYLPVSSSGHLAIGSALFGIEGEENLAFTVIVHVATVFSTLVILWKEISWIFKGLAQCRMNDETRYFINIVISMIPVGIVGVFFKDYVEEIFGSGLAIVGSMLLVTALLLTFSYFAKPRQKANISKRDALHHRSGTSSGGAPRTLPFRLHHRHRSASRQQQRKTGAVLIHHGHPADSRRSPSRCGQDAPRQRRQHAAERGSAVAHCRISRSVHLGLRGLQMDDQHRETRQTDIFRHLLRPGRRRNIDFQLHLTEKRCCIP